MALLHLALLGGVQIRLAAGRPIDLPTKAQALLAYLVFRPGQAHPRDKLATLLWADAPAERARHSLRQSLIPLRQAFGPDDPPGLLDQGATVAVDPEAVDVDVHAFERLVTQGTPESLAQAAARYRGNLLEGLSVHSAPFDEWLTVERERLRELAVDALVRLLAHQERTGSVDAAVESAIQLLELDPVQEPVHRLLMRLYVRQGRRGAALRHYQVCAAALRHQIGVEPEAETRRLYQDLLQTPAQEPLAPRWDTPAPSALAGPSVADIPPLVGRESERGWLKDVCERAWAGRGRVAVIRGEAGIGKSRLMSMMATDALQRGVRVLTGRAMETLQSMPFGIWIDAYRTGNVALGTMEPSWRSELARLFPELETTRPATPASMQDHLRLFDAMAQVLREVAATHPVLLVFEDLHWADEMSLRLLGFVSRRLQDRPVLIAATLRADELSGSPVLRQLLAELDHEGILDPLSVVPLTRADSDRLVQGLARVGTQPGDLARLAERAWQLSEGNPFIVVESIRMVGETAALTEDAALALPRRVRDTIARHLDRLGDSARQVGALAALIGREFDFELLQRASGLDPQRAAEAVEELVARQVLHVIGDLLDFTHDRIRTVAIEDLLPHRRALLHAAIGQAIEQRHAGRLDLVYDRLAFHYARTGEHQRAVTYLTGFAEQAARAYANSDAGAALDEAIRHAEQLPETARERTVADLAVRQALSLSILGRLRDVLERLAPHRDTVERLADPGLAGRYFFRVGLTHSSLGNLEQATLDGERALVEATRASDAATIGNAEYLLSSTSYYLGFPSRGVEHGEAAVTHLQRGSETHWLGLSHWSLAMNRYTLGDFDRALSEAARIAAIGADTRDRRLQSFAAWTEGWIRAVRGDGDAAIEACRRGVELAPDPTGVVLARARLGHAYLEQGDTEHALPFLEESVAAIARVQLRLIQGHFTAFLAETCLRRSDLPRARFLAEQALELNTQVKRRHESAWARRVLGRIAMAERALAEATEHFEHALAEFAQIPAPFEIGRTHLDLAELSHARGDRDAAAQHLAQALRAFTTLKVAGYVERATSLAARLGLSPAAA
jgi:DNA-binding SARP family transcriptional activator